LLIVFASLGAVLNIGKTIVGVGGLIFVHELGHFLVGRWCGVYAEAFSIGFGPVLFKWKGKPTDPARPEQTTEYRLSAIPLGGYVKFLGENPDERADPDPRSFNAATYPRKVAIMLAGVTMNVIAAFALFAFVFSAGWDTVPPIAGDVVPGLPAWEHGVKKGDEVVSIDGRRILDFSDLQQETVFADAVEVVVKRDGSVLPAMQMPTRDGGDGLRVIGIGYPLRTDGAFGVEADSVAEKAGFKPGDRVVAVDGKPASDLAAARKLQEAAKAQTVWTVMRDGGRLELTLPWRTKPHPMIGISMGSDSETIVVAKDGPAAAAGLVNGDHVASVGGVATKYATEFLARLGDAATTGDVVVRRGDREVRVPVPAGDDRAAFDASIASGAGSGAVRAWLLPGPSPARAAGLPDGCALLSIDDHPVASSADAVAAVAKAFELSRPASIKWRDDAGHEGATSVSPKDEPDPDLCGIVPLVDSRRFAADGVGEALALASDRTERWVLRIFRTLGSLFSGGVSASKLSGPIGISTVGYHHAKSSLGDFLMFLGMLSMNLAVLNVVPLPLLDGGQLAVHTIERIRRKPIPERVLEAVMWSGLILLVGFVLYVSKNDIVNLMR
jgi:regulator of sigma E protease